MKPSLTPLAGFLFLLLFLQRVRAGLSACDVTIGSNTFELSKIPKELYIGADGSGAEWYYNMMICGAVPSSLCTGAAGAVAQTSTPGTGPCEALVVTSWSGDNGAPVPAKLIDSADPGKGVVLSFDNGDTCPHGNNRQWIITFSCDPTQESPGPAVGTWKAQEDPVGSCNYKATFPTKYACLGTAPSPGPAPTTGGGWGATFNIIFIVTTSCYFVFGAAYQKKFNDASSLKEFIPNQEFWADLPGLCWDGVQFVNEKVSGLVGGGYNRL
jgi:hypothetical protein